MFYIHKHIYSRSIVKKGQENLHYSTKSGIKFCSGSGRGVFVVCYDQKL